MFVLPFKRHERTKYKGYTNLPLFCLATTNMLVRLLFCNGEQLVYQQKYFSKNQMGVRFLD